MGDRGVEFNSGGDDSTISNLIIRDTDSHGVWAANVQEATIRNTIIYGTNANGINIGAGARVAIENSTRVYASLIPMVFEPSVASTTAPWIRAWTSRAASRMTWMATHGPSAPAGRSAPTRQPAS